MESGLLCFLILSLVWFKYIHMDFEGAAALKSQNISRDSSSLQGPLSHHQVLGLLVSALLFSHLLPVSFLFTHSFCFLITLACIWFWLVVSSSVPPGTLVVAVPLLTGSALRVF